MPADRACSKVPAWSVCVAGTECEQGRKAAKRADSGVNLKAQEEFLNFL